MENSSQSVAEWSSYKNLPESFTSKLRLDDQTGCWIWTAAQDRKGYGAFKFERRSYRAHRFSYTQIIGLISKELQLDHLCRVRLCVNPFHLEAVSAGENIRRGETGAVWAAKTHCPYGHEYSIDNTYVCPNGSRNCRICMKERKQKWNLKHRGII